MPAFVSGGGATWRTFAGGPQGVRYLSIGPELYLWAQRDWQDAAGIGSLLGTYSDTPNWRELDGHRIYAASIAPRSEVRGVRIAASRRRLHGKGQAGPWTELVEGGVVELDAPEDGVLALDRLHWTDGVLTLALAVEPDAVARLPVDVQPAAALRWASRLHEAGNPLYLQHPAPFGRLRTHLRWYNGGGSSVTWTIKRHSVSRGDVPTDDELLSDLDQTEGTLVVASGAVGETSLPALAHGDVVSITPDLDATGPGELSLRNE